MPRIVEQWFDDGFADARDSLIAMARCHLAAEGPDMGPIAQWLDEEHSDQVVRREVKQRRRLARHKAIGTPEPDSGFGAPAPAQEARSARLTSNSLAALRLERALLSLLQGNRAGALTQLLGRNLPRGTRTIHALRAVLVCGCILDPDAGEWLGPATALARSSWEVSPKSKEWDSTVRARDRSDVCKLWSREALALLNEACRALGWTPASQVRPDSEPEPEMTRAQPPTATESYPVSHVQSNDHWQLRALDALSCGYNRLVVASLDNVRSFAPFVVSHASADVTTIAAGITVRGGDNSEANRLRLAAQSREHLLERFAKIVTDLARSQRELLSSKVPGGMSPLHAVAQVQLYEPQQECEVAGVHDATFLEATFALTDRVLMAAGITGFSSLDASGLGGQFQQTVTFGDGRTVLHGVRVAEEIDELLADFKADAVHARLEQERRKVMELRRHEQARGRALPPEHDRTFAASANPAAMRAIDAQSGPATSAGERALTGDPREEEPAGAPPTPAVDLAAFHALIESTEAIRDEIRGLRAAAATGGDGEGETKSCGGDDGAADQRSPAMSAAVRRAGASLEWVRVGRPELGPAESAAERYTRAEYDYIRENDCPAYRAETGEPIQAPAWQTWARYIREYLRLSGGPANSPRAGRPTGRSIARAGQV